MIRQKLEKSPVSDQPTTRRRRSVKLGQEWPMILWLMLVWLALTSDLRPLNIVFALLLSVSVILTFPLPPIHRRGRINPLRAVLFIVDLLWQSLVASVRVLALAVRQGPRTLSSIVKVPLVTRDELLTTVMSHALAIVPGSVVVEVDTQNGALYVHVLGVSTQKEVDDFLRSARATEGRILNMMGSREECERWELNAASQEALATHRTPREEQA